MRPHAIPFDLRSLEIFLTICDQGTMASTARILGLTQPAISQAIAEIEERTGTILFDRSVRPLGLTPAGAVLRQRAATLISDARQIAPLLRETRRGKMPILRVGYVDSLCRAIVPELAAHLASSSDYVSMVWGLTSAHADAIMTRRLDLFLGVDDVDLLEELSKWALIEEPYVLVTPASAPEIVSVADLKTYAKGIPFIRYSQRTRVGRTIELHLRRLGFELPLTQEFDVPFALSAAVANGNGWAISTPLCVYESSIPADRVRLLPLPGAGITRRLSLIAHKRELGSLPADIAEFSRRLLRDKCVPSIVELFPWLTDQMIIDGN